MRLVKTVPVSFPVHIFELKNKNCCTLLAGEILQYIQTIPDSEALAETIESTHSEYT